jgi:hypothetical protein
VQDRDGLCRFCSITACIDPTNWAYKRRSKRKLDSGNGELYDFYTSLNSTGVIKSRKMRWAMHIAHTVEEINAHRGMVGKLENRDQLEDLGVNGRIVK